MKKTGSKKKKETKGVCREERRIFSKGLPSSPSQKTRHEESKERSADRKEGWGVGKKWG